MKKKIDDKIIKRYANTSFYSGVFSLLLSVLGVIIYNIGSLYLLLAPCALVGGLMLGVVSFISTFLYKKVSDKKSDKKVIFGVISAIGGFILFLFAALMIWVVGPFLIMESLV